MLRRLVPVFALLFCSLTAAAGAQSLPGLPFSSPAPAGTGPATSAPIVLDGQTLFTVATGSQQDALPVITRASDIETVLAQITATTGSGASAQTAYDPSSLRVLLQRDGDENAIDVVDGRHRDPLPVVTITSADAKAHGVSNGALAAQWQETLQGALVQALVRRQPAQERRAVLQVALIAIVLVSLSIVAFAIVRSISGRIDRLADDLERDRRELVEAGSAPAASDTAGAETHRRRIRSASLRAATPERRLGFSRAVRATLVLVSVALWFGGATYCAMLFPQTSPVGHAAFANGIAIAAIWLIAALLDRAFAAVIARLPLLWALRPFADADDRARRTLRMPTIVRALGGFKTFVLVFLAVLATMTQVGIPIGSVVTIGGVAAIAVSLAAQNLLRDVVSGFLVLSEDQFVVGDSVTINATYGLVERLTLRMVQIRDTSGSLVTIAHSAATSVSNHSRDWSRVDYAVSVEVSADADRALAIVRTAIEALRRDDAWKDAVESTEWIGVDGLSKDGIVIRARIKTAPLRQYAVERELNERVAKAFAAEKIGFGVTPPPAAV